MAIIWCGGEPIDFINPGNFVVTYAGRFRSGYARCGLNQHGVYNDNYSYAFTGGAITSCWFTFRMYHLTSSLGSYTGYWIAGLVNDSFSGIVVAIGASNNDSLALEKTDGTVLATETGTSLLNYDSTYVKIDVCVTDIDGGSNGNIKVYIGSAEEPIIDYTGNISPPVGNAEVTRVSIHRYMYHPWQPNYEGAISEIIVADEDTRLMNLVTHYPSAAGDTNDWTGAYTAIDEYTTNDDDLIYTTDVNDDFQCNLSNLPSGTGSIFAVKISARSIVSGSGIQSLKLGIKSGGSIDVDSGHILSTVWGTKERLMQINPVTSAAFNTAEIDALQINLRSAS